MKLNTIGKSFICNLILLLGPEFVQCEYNFTYAMASRCKEHISPGEYKYTTFYRINANNRKFKPGVVFDMHFAVLASNNAYILLSPMEKPQSTDPGYEIAIGAGGNVFTEVRILPSRVTVVLSPTKGILSPIDFRAFWINVTEDGLIEFGKEGAALATLSYHAVNPLPIRYFSFSALTGVQAKFLYDCSFGQNKTDPAGNSTLVEAKVNYRQKLRNNTINRGRGKPDGNRTIINITATVADLRFDSENCSLEAAINLVVSWANKSISWPREIYNRTDHLSVRNHEIWIPELVLYNSVGHGVLQPDGSESVQVTSKGVATLRFKTRQQVTCAFSNKTKYRWPRDEYECNFLIGPKSMQDIFAINLLTNSTVANYSSFSDIPTFPAEWNVTNTTLSIITSQEWHSNNESNSASDEVQRFFKIHVAIKRKSYINFWFLTKLFIIIIIIVCVGGVIKKIRQKRLNV